KTDSEWVYISDNMRQKETNPISIHLSTCIKHNELLSFIHELAHIITPYIEIKRKDEWVCEAHSIIFYKNFLEIISLINTNKNKYSNIINIDNIDELMYIDRK